MKRRAWVCDVVYLQETEGHQMLIQQKRFIIVVRLGEGSRVLDGSDHLL